MPSYLLSFRTPTDYQSTPDTRAAWNEFFQAISTHLEDIGNPIFNRQTIGDTGTDTWTANLDDVSFGTPTSPSP